MQVNTLSAQLGLGSELVDWYRDITSVPYGLLLIDLLPRPDDWLSYCTNTGSNPSNFQDWGWNSKKIWTMNTPNLSILQVFQSFSHKFKRLFLQSCPKGIIRFLCECIIILLKGNRRSMKRHHVAKFQSEVWLLSLKRTTWKRRREILASEKGLQLIKVNSTAVNNHLSWYRAVCPRTTKVWLPILLQRRSFQSINLHKIPRTKLIHLRGR